MANINIYGELHNDTPEGYVTPSQQIMDTELGKRQDQINRELVDEVRDMGLETAYLTCSTPGNTWKKTISATDFSLSTNVRLLIKMEHSHTSPNSPTLNINETGEYTIQYGGRGASNINSWTDNEVLDVYFDGTQYIARGVENRTGYLVCNTLADTAAKTVDCPAFDLNTYVRVLVKITYTNTASNPTLNINGTGDKGIIYNGVAVSSENVWEAGEVLDVYYNGTNYIATTYGIDQFATGEKVNNVGIDDTPTSGSNNLVKSGGVVNKFNELFTIENQNLFDIENLDVESEGANITHSVSGGELTIVNSGTNNQTLGLYLPDTNPLKSYTFRVNATNAKSIILYKGTSTNYEILTVEGTEYSIEYTGTIGYWFRITVGNGKTCVVSSVLLEEKNPEQFIKPELVKNIDEDSFSQEYKDKQSQLFSDGNIFFVESSNIISYGSNISYTKEGSIIKVTSSGSGQAKNYINIGLPNTKLDRTYSLSFRASNLATDVVLYRGLSEAIATLSPVEGLYHIDNLAGGYDYLLKFTVANNQTAILSDFNLTDTALIGQVFVNPNAMFYDNGNSSLNATKVNDAIDELDTDLQERITDNDFNAQVNNRLANLLYETLEHYNIEHPNSPIIAEDVLVRGVIPSEARRYRIPTTIITNAKTILVAAEHRGNVVAGDATDASIHLARKEAGSTEWEYQNVIPFINYTTSYGRTYDPSFVIDRTGNNTGVTGRIFLFGGMSTNDGSWITDTEETNDLMYKYSDDDGETWSNLVSLKSIVDYSVINCILTSPNNGIQLSNGTLVVPCFCSLKNDDNVFKYSTILLIKEAGSDWRLSSITPSEQGIAECAIIETSNGKIILAARTNANYGNVNEETKYSHLWEYDIVNDTWTKLNSTFVENAGCQWSLTKIPVTINGVVHNVYLKSAVDSVNSLRTNISIWASLDLNKWMRVYRVYAPSGNGYSVADYYDGELVVAYETSVDNYSISFQDVTAIIPIIEETATSFLVNNVCVQDMMQLIINKFLTLN